MQRSLDFISTSFTPALMPRLRLRSRAYRKNRGSAALVFCPDAFLYSRRAQIAALQARYAVPAIFDVREYADAGALVSYGNNFLDVMQEAGRYTGRVLKGDKPSELPVPAAGKIRIVDQSEDRQGARADDTSRSLPWPTK